MIRKWGPLKDGLTAYTNCCIRVKFTEFFYLDINNNNCYFPINRIRKGVKSQKVVPVTKTVLTNDFKTEEVEK
jgi:hypothetical protein